MRIAALALFLSLVAAPASANEVAARLLAVHNAERARWNVPPLTWDPALAAAADRWASEMARTGSWGHSPKPTRPGQGENLWMGTRGAFNVEGMAAGWLSERRWFRPGVFPAVSSSGNWSDVGHYTQIVTRNSTRVGCAVRSSRQWDYLVCRYNPSGNVDGRPVF